MTATVASGTFADSSLTLSATFYTTAGVKVTDKTFVVTKTTELTPAPVSILTYHDTTTGTDTSCDFE
jgi:hypothetical protein